jgi:hypothetical protein
MAQAGQQVVGRFHTGRGPMSAAILRARDVIRVEHLVGSAARKYRWNSALKSRRY